MFRWHKIRNFLWVIRTHYRKKFLCIRQSNQRFEYLRYLTEISDLNTLNKTLLVHKKNKTQQF